MKKYTRLLILLLALVMLVQSTAIGALALQPIDTSVDYFGASGQPTKYSKQYNSGKRGTVATTLNGTSADDYYYGTYEYDCLSEQTATQIKNSLASLMQSTHKKISSYDDCHYKANRTDCEEENGKVTLIYTGYQATMNEWNGWNREHVWPKSLGGDSQTGGGADLHHIRPSDASVNSSRGNKKYGESNNGTAKYGSNPASGYLGGHYNSTYFEPLDNVKGDVARICLYVYVRWGSDWGASNITSVFQSIDILLEWCELDPVDTWELGRNEVIEDIQGNRNVFIDYPEYAWLIFGREVPDDMVTPSGEAMEDSSTGSGTTTPPSGGDSGDDDPTTPPSTGGDSGEDNPTTPPSGGDSGEDDPTTPPSTGGDSGEDNPTTPPSSGNGNENTPSTPQHTAEEFVSAVNSIILSDPHGEELYNAICNAVTIYSGLSDADKASVQTKYNQLVEFANIYNASVTAYNKEVTSTVSTVLNAVVITTVSTFGIGLCAVLGKKYF